MEREQRMTGGLVTPGCVRLGLEASTREEAVRATAELLAGDPRLGDWGEFWSSVGPKQVVDLGASGVCLAHGRSGAAKRLALAASRLAHPVPADPEPLRAVIVFAIPLAMSEEYLRAVGAIARACGDPRRRAELLEARAPNDFAALLAEWAA